MTSTDGTKERFATAAGPFASATVVRTSAGGLDTRRTTIPVGDFAMPVYVARPAQGADLPVILVLSEAFGLHAHIEDIARRFAHLGYLAVAPDLMKRQGDPQSFDTVDELVGGLLQRIPDAQVMGDLDAAVDWAVGNGGDASRVAATGFCWGGRWAWLYAAHARIAAAVAWYGILDGVQSGAYPDPELFPAHPIDVARSLRTPVLGIYGGQDDAIPLATVEAMRDALADGAADAPDARISVHGDAGHAFFADYRETYRRDSAQGAWREATTWLRDHGA